MGMLTSEEMGRRRCCTQSLSVRSSHSWVWMYRRTCSKGDQQETSQRPPRDQPSQNKQVSTRKTTREQRTGKRTADSSDEKPGDDQPVVEDAFTPVSLPPNELAKFAGEFYAPELDATYRFSVVGGNLVVRIEQEPPLQVAPVGDDKFVFKFHPHGWQESRPVTLAFDRNGGGAITGFRLSLGSERGIVFQRR